MAIEPEVPAVPVIAATPVKVGTMFDLQNRISAHSPASKLYRRLMSLYDHAVTTVEFCRKSFTTSG